MTKLIILGSSNSIPTLQHDNTHMVVVGDEKVLLIDTATNPILRLSQAGVDLSRLTDLILTHFHPDHVSGVPMLLLDSCLLGRRLPLAIYSLADTIERIEKMMALFGWEEWPNFFPVKFTRLLNEEKAPVLQSPEFSVTASPVQHMVPNIGLRIDFHRSNQSLVYSSDTTPAPSMVRLAQGADVLIHEATGAEFGHTSAAQAGEIASQAGVKKLVLIHYNPFEPDHQHLIDEAKSTFAGPVELAQDFMTFDF
jgi:ribonuclease Z